MYAGDWILQHSLPSDRCLKVSSRRRGEKWLHRCPDTSPFTLIYLETAWKQFIDGAVILPYLGEEGISADLMEDVKKPTRPKEATHSAHQADGHRYSRLRLQGFADDDLVNVWTLLGAKRLRTRGNPLRRSNEAAKPAPTLRRQYSFAGTYEWLTDSEDEEAPYYNDFGVHAMKIDQIDQVLLTTSSKNGGGLRVTCRKSGELLWSDKSVKNKAHLEFQEGWAVTSDLYSSSKHVLQIWRFDRLGRTHRARSFAKRGVLQHTGTLSPSQPCRAFRLHWPNLFVLTSDLNLLVYDVCSGNLLSTTNIKPTIILQPDEGPWSPAYIEVDDDCSFNLLHANRHYEDATHVSRIHAQWCLQIFSRQEPGRLAWQLGAADVTSIQAAMNAAKRSDRDRWYYFSSQNRQSFITEKARWDYSAMILRAPSTGGGFDDKDVGGEYRRRLESEAREKGLYWPIDEEPFGIGVDSKTESLCILAGTTLTVLTDYKEMLSRSKQQCQPITLRFASDEGYHVQRSLAVFNGMAAFNLNESMVFIDLQKIIAGQGRAVLRFQSLMQVHWEQQVPDCTSIFLDESTLGFQTLALGDRCECGLIHDSSCTKAVVTLDFAELGKVPDSEKLSSSKRSDLIELPVKE